MNQDISIYIHIPFCKSKCIYCDFFSKVEFCTESFFTSYIGALCKEIIFYSRFNKTKILKTIYIGGGTPSIIPIELLKQLFDCIENNFKIDFDQYECTIEVNPDDVSEKFLDFLNKSIVNRISLGIQSLKTNTLKLMNRRASKDVNLFALNLISQKFTKRFSVDLIAGFPNESKKELIENIQKVISFNPEHISLYSLCVEKETELSKKIENNLIKYNQNLSDKIWLSAKDFLINNGFEQYEISNFAKNPNAQSSHNLVYWHLKNYYGFGSGATGSLFFLNDNSLRYTNFLDIKKYVLFWNSFDINEFIKNKNCKVLDFEFLLKNNFPLSVEKIDNDTQEFEFFMMGFRLSKGISKNEYEKRFNKSLYDRLNLDNNLFSGWVKKGFAEIQIIDDDEYYRLTQKGLLYLNFFLEQL